MEDDVIDLDEFARKEYLAKADDLKRGYFPVLQTFSIGPMLRFLPVPTQPDTSVEFAYVPDVLDAEVESEKRARYMVFVEEWNRSWESGRERVMIDRDTPRQFEFLYERCSNIQLVPKTGRSNYHAYAPLFHLLPQKTREQFGLPLVRRGIWPHGFADPLALRLLPSDVDRRFEKALTYHLWPLLCCRGKPSHYTADDPVRIISHSPEFWLPYLELVIQRRVRQFGRVTRADDLEKDRAELQLPDDVTIERPLKGGHVWAGEDEAEDVTREMIELADANGNLRSIIDAVRSNRVQDDFSRIWSREKEDFERKFYHKRAKTKVAFVEMHGTIPFHGPDAQVQDPVHDAAEEALIWQDMIAICKPKEREVVVCLRNGITKHGDIAKKLGYANHSAVSKRLAKIRERAMKVLR